MLKKHESERDTVIRRKKFIRYIWAASYFMGIGIYVAATVAFCIWLGMKADDYFGIAPNGTLAGIFLGFPTAIYSIYHQVRVHFFDDGNKKNDGQE